ncbi:hypothetical protein pipiens_010749 [Culex pipiens pipiens]|uniref:Uncharacterized protein n=1 Tax=Culex pipiens pipiens TaxID=38569 RepID=A0ABD1D9W4_CULPP
MLIRQVIGGDRQFPSPSARGQRAYPDSDEEPWGIVNRELAEIIQPPVTPILLDVQSDTVDDCWSRGLVAEQHEKTWLFYTVDNGAVELTSDDKQIPYRVLQMDIARVIMKKLEFKPAFGFPARGLLKQLFESKSNIFDGVKLIDLNMNRSLGALLLENHDKKPNVAARAKEINCTEEAVGKGSEVPTGAAKNNV